MREFEQFLKLLAHYAVTAKLNSGARVLDASDFQRMADRVRREIPHRS
jgi:hypothetical protein